MNHPAELAIRAYLNRAVKGEGTISEDNLEQIASDVKSALKRQFAGPPREDFRLRMSNLGRPTCQLWYDKNKPEVAEPFPSNFLMNMVLGDLVEAVFKGLLREANVEFNDATKVTLKVGDTEIKGECDLTIGNTVDDIKSASPWSYKNKFESYGALSSEDSFGYVSQLAGYAQGLGVDVGGWWVVNKGNGDFKYVSAQEMDVKEVNKNIKKTIDYINKDKPFKRCYEAQPETYRKVASGNYVLPRGCTFCKYKKDCWDTLQELPSLVSNAKEPPMVQYVSLAEPDGV
tara:strand:- start:926 stop:1786 length:861 start_codon:yes stop_codon:yes gene_type:complete